ncbi:Squamosa promoter-binding-like protein [Pleodorina starrii]|nr:Squamosa promoter-binding-like protein [Pleodorina starrii]
MQSGDDAAAAAADTVATQNLLASIAGILQGTTAAVPPGPPTGAPLAPTPGQGGPGGSPTANRTSSNGGSNPAGAQGGVPGLSPGLILLPAGLPLLNAPGLQGLGSYLQLLPGLAGGMGADGSMPFALPPLGLDGNLNQLNLAALLGAGGFDLEGQGADLSGLDPSRKAGGFAGSKRPADGSAGAPYKRERSEEGRAREGKCHVEGCNADLTGLSSYYQRYRTCEQHLKAPSIMKDGLQQRFCQQCGRFHELTEFDGNKRSCRSRLQSHNVRRRKRTEEQMANAAAESQAVPAGQGALQAQGLGGLGLQPLQPQHGLLQPNLQDLLQQPGMESLLNSALAGVGQDPSKAPKPDDALAALLNTLPQTLLNGLNPPGDASQAALQLALQTLNTEHLAAAPQPQLLESLLKAGAPHIPGELPTPELQQQLSLMLAGAPAAAASIVGEPQGGVTDGAGGLGAHLGDPHGHAAAHGHAEAHHPKAEGALGAPPGVHVPGPGEGHPAEAGPQM